MATVAYCTLQDAKDALGGQWGFGKPTGPGSASTTDSILTNLTVVASRQFDRETGKPTGYWAPATNIGRLYSVSGNQWLDIGDWDLVTGVQMATKADRSDSVTLELTYDPTRPGDYVVVYPVSPVGPPFNRLFLLRGWLPDPFAIGNITVTGNVVTPEEINRAVAVWAAYMFKARDAAYGDSASNPDGGPGKLYLRAIPPDVQAVIGYYKNARLGPDLALEDGTERERRSPWLGWITSGN